MSQYVGLDVSLKETSVCVLDGSGRIVWRGICKATPEAMAATLGKRAPEAERVVLESGTLSGRPNKSDELDAEGLAQLARPGWYAEVRVKSYDSHRVRSVLVARAKLVAMKRTLSNTIRSLLKTFGLFTQRARGKAFADRVRELMADEPLLGKGIEGLLASWEAVSRQVRDLDRLLSGLARRDPVCRDVLMTAPGVGAITVLAFKSVIDDPARFKRGEEVGAYLGLAPKRHQSGDTDRMGCISRCGDALLRGYLSEAATVAMMRVRRDNAPTAWAWELAKRSGSGKARVALARKLAVILFAM